MPKKLKYDLRTEREKLRDEHCEIIGRRFRELYPYAPNPSRVFAAISNELGLNQSVVRSYCIRLGLFSPGSRTKNGEKVVWKVNL